MYLHVHVWSSGEIRPHRSFLVIDFVRLSAKEGSKPSLRIRMVGIVNGIIVLMMKMMRRTLRKLSAMRSYSLRSEGNTLGWTTRSDEPA